MKTKLTNLRIFAFVLMLGLILTSCSKDDAPADIIVGTWTVSNATYSAKIGDKTLLEYFTDVMGLSALEAQQYALLFEMGMSQGLTGTIQVKSDNTYVSNIGGEADSGTWSLTADGKKLTIDSIDSEPVTFDIVELTSSKLNIIMMESMNEDLNGDDIPETISATIDITFTK